MKKQIIAMGGGGFSMEPDNLAFEKYILNVSQKENPNVCFVGTASGDNEDYIKRFYTAFNTLNCSPTFLSLFKPPVGSLEEFVLKQDVIYVGGGNTKNLLALWREWGLNSILKKAYEKGVILAGLSAGSICWFEEGTTDSIPGKLTALECLGFLKGSHCPHYDGEVERRPSYHQMIKDGMKPGIACDDGAAAHFVDGELFKVVTSRETANAYEVKFENNQICEIKLKKEFLL